MVSRTLTANDGLELVVRAYGTGESVVLLHGATLDAAWNWERPGIAAALVDAGYRVVLLDLRGHGASGRPLDAQALRLDAYTEDVRLLLSALELGRAPLVGYSLGSLIALQAAARDSRVTGVFAGGLALELIQPEPLPPDREAYLEQLAADRDEVVSDPQAIQVRAWDRSQGHDPKARAALIRSLRLPREVDFDSVRVPTVVETGDEEPAPDSLVAKLPNARGVRVKGDHSTALDDPALATVIVEFIETLR